MLGDYLNQTATHTPAQRNPDGSAAMDQRGTVQYRPPSSVACRKTKRYQEIMTAHEQMIKSTMVYYTEIPVEVDDLLDGKRVADVAEWVDLDGSIAGYKAVT